MTADIPDNGPRAQAQSADRLSLCVLASGSRGNAIYVSDGTTRILVDAGLSGKQIEHRLRLRNLDPQALDAIVVSHEHGDHIQGVGVLARRYKIPIYITGGTYQAAAAQLGKIANVKHFSCGQTFFIERLQIHPFSISHDAEDPAGFTIQSNGAKIGIATDLGIATEMVRTRLQDCSALVLEANHDPEMLMAGPYPWPLKQRISGRSGHLSNSDTKNLLKSLVHNRLEYIILAHLSEVNNSPKRAFSAVRAALGGKRISLHVSCQDQPGELVILR